METPAVVSKPSAVSAIVCLRELLAEGGHQVSEPVKGNNTAAGFEMTAENILGCRLVTGITVRTSGDSENIYASASLCDDAFCIKAWPGGADSAVLPPDTKPSAMTLPCLTDEAIAELNTVLGILNEELANIMPLASFRMPDNTNYTGRVIKFNPIPVNSPADRMGLNLLPSDSSLPIDDIVQYIRTSELVKLVKAAVAGRKEVMMAIPQFHIQYERCSCGAHDKPDTSHPAIGSYVEVDVDYGDGSPVITQSFSRSGSRFFFVIDTTDGKVLWQYELSDVIDHFSRQDSGHLLLQVPSGVLPVRCKAAPSQQKGAN